MGKLILYIHSVIIAIDIIATLMFITKPQKDIVHGGAGQALMIFYGLAIIVFFIGYALLFWWLYNKKRFTAATIMFWLLVGFNVYVAVVMVSSLISFVY